MKKLLLPVLACGMFASAIAQTEPAEPCCNIIATKVENNTIIARDKTTGRLYQFKADALDMKAVKVNDAVNVSGGKVTSISGAKRMYVTVRPDQLEPCCAIVSIQPDPVEPCCNVVTFKNNATGTLSKFSAPKNISNTLSKGDPVYAEPVNDLTINTAEPSQVKNIEPDRAEPITEFAIIQTSMGNSGQMASYGYPVTSAGNNAAEKWVINRLKTKSGMGKLYATLHQGAGLNLTIYAAGSDKVLSFTSDKTSFNLLPGLYDLEISKIRITNVPVEKGNETRLKAGMLHITNPTAWTLYDAAKQTVLHFSSSAEKIGLPIGKYKLTIMDQDTDIEIKDGETVEY